MEKTFNVLTSTVPVAQFAFAGQQQERARAHGVTRVFRFRFIAGDMSRLPKYIASAINAAGFIPVHVGGTTYRYSVVGLVPVVPVIEDDDNAVPTV